MKALILNNKVVDVKENEFDVPSTMSWVDCNNTVKTGFIYDGSTFTSNEPTAEEIAKAQAKRKAFADLRVSAKEKLIAGEPLTKEEADTIAL